MNLETILRKLPSGGSPAASLRGAFVVASLLLVAIAWSAIAFSHQRLTEFQLATSQRQQWIEQHPQLKLKADQLRQQVQQTQADCQLLVAKLPAHPSESELLNLLSEAATHCNVALGDYRPGSVRTTALASEIELRLRATGNYVSLCQWLHDLDQLPRTLNITHLTFIGPSAAGGDCTVDLQLMLVFGYSGKIN